MKFFPIIQKINHANHRCISIWYFGPSNQSQHRLNKTPTTNLFIIYLRGTAHHKFGPILPKQNPQTCSSFPYRRTYIYHKLHAEWPPIVNGSLSHKGPLCLCGTDSRTPSIFFTSARDPRSLWIVKFPRRDPREGEGWGWRRKWFSKLVYEVFPPGDCSRCKNRLRPTSRSFVCCAPISCYINMSDDSKSACII